MAFRAQDSIKYKKLYRGLDMRILTCYNNIMHPGIAKLVSRLVWDQETVRSSRTTRTKIPLKSLISEGFSYSLSIAAQEVSLSFLTHLFDNRRLNIVIFAELQYNQLTVGLYATKAAVWVYSHTAFVYKSSGW